MKPATLIAIMVALAAGIFFGIKLQTGKTTQKSVVAQSPADLAQDAILTDNTTSRVQQLEQQITALQQRVEQLERTIHESTNVQTMEQESTQQNASFDSPRLSSAVDTPVTANSRVLSAEHLVKSGVDPATADDIVRRKNEIELQKLELRDRAAREGYLGSSRYMQELQALIDEDFSLRAELGDEAYDRYLYASGQANRVRVAAVIPGSAAEQAGVKDGDLIIRYGETRLFDWRELQQATTRGSRDEYVNLSVMRDGQETLLWVPRGPLGVRLSMMRVNPDR